MDAASALGAVATAASLAGTLVAVAVGAGAYAVWAIVLGNVSGPS